jgi:hypothetical protein
VSRRGRAGTGIAKRLALVYMRGPQQLPSREATVFVSNRLPISIRDI